MAEHALAAAPAARAPRRETPGAAWMLGALALAFALLAPGFLSSQNLVNIANQSAILLMIALPMTLIIMTEGLDLSAGSVLTLCSVVLAAMLVRTGGSIGLSLPASLAVGVAFGVVNGLLVARAGVPPFVATLGTLGAAQGLALVVTDGQSIVGLGESLGPLYTGTVAGLPVPLLFALASWAALHGLLYHTRFGTYVFALGGNRDALRFAGVRVERCLVWVYVLGGAMSGLAALLLTARMNAGHPTSAIGMEFDAIAAVAVGGTSFERGNGWLFGTVLGVFAIGVLRNGLNLMAIPSSVQVAAIGVLVIVALLIDGFGRKR
ncbi:MAG TPA: ABC transporter permease [Burkholderiaceae bacterium]|nr:ABC transporter permease [Burkholderiaceae bacterium]